MVKILGITITGEGGGVPSDSVTPETSFGVSNLAGVATTYSRGDHTHGSPTNPVPAHATLDTGVHGVSSSTVDSVSNRDGAISTHTSNAAAHHTKFTTIEHDTTGRHILGTVVPHDALANLTERSHTNLTDKGTNTHAQLDTHLAATASTHGVGASGFEDKANRGAISGYAPLDAASKVPTVNLGGSGADATKYLRGDQTWAAPAGGGGDGEATVVATQNTANATVNLTNATGLVFAALANSTYIIEGFIVWNANATSVGIKLSATGPSSPTIMAGNFITNAANGTPDSSAFNADNIVVTTSASPFTTSNLGILNCVLKTGANAGNFQVRFAAETTGTITILAGSTLRYRKVA